MKKILYLFVSLLIVISSILIVSCNDSGEPSGSPMETLDAPTNINIDKRILTWDAVENASGYIVSFANVEYETAEPTFSLRFHGDGGEYDVQIKTVGDGESFWNSDWSEIATFTLSERVAEGCDDSGFKYTLLEDGSGYEANLNYGYADLRGYVTIPDYFGDYPVKRIGKRIFTPPLSMGNLTNYFTEQNCNTLTTGIKLPSELESIAPYAFYALVRLEEIVIPDTVTEIGERAFEGCTHLTKVVLPKGLKTIPGGCFKNTALSEINLPETLEEIGGSAFKCEYTEIVGGYNTRYRGSCRISEPFYVTVHISSELSSVVIPSSVKRIGGHAFYGRENLEVCVIPNTVEFINLKILGETKWYENQPDGFLYIGEGNCFLYGYKGEVPAVIDNIPSHVTGICGGAFSSTNLKKIVIPDGVKLIGEAAFQVCSELSEVCLPSDLESIPSNSFSYTPSLKSITLPKTLENIGIDAFANSGLERITIPGSCKIIERYAFSQCENLSEIVLEEGIESIGVGAFSRTAVKTIIWPKSLKT